MVAKDIFLVQKRCNKIIEIEQTEIVKYNSQPLHFSNLTNFLLEQKKSFLSSERNGRRPKIQYPSWLQ
jgi:hypothetical protein